MILLKSLISLIDLGLAIIFLTTYSGDGEDVLLDGILGWGAILLLANAILIWS